MSDNVVPMPEPRPATECPSCGGDKSAPVEFCWDCQQHLEMLRKVVADEKKARVEHQRALRRVDFFSKHRKFYIQE